MNAAQAGKCRHGTEEAPSHFPAMRARLALILVAVALPACSSQADKQLEAVKSARRVLAEWALVEEQADKGRAQHTYTEQMRAQAKDQLKTAQTGLSDQPVAARLIRQLRAGSPDTATLHAADSALEPLEDQLESA
jgi:hypothetical protein